MDAFLEFSRSYRLGCAEFYSADFLFAIETFLIKAESCGEALALARMYAEQSPYFNLGIPHLACLVRVRQYPFPPGLPDL
ncbi:hypothetical protein [Novosphingobium sp. ZW T3_23]|uniref:hypothetical protein n=1 Tax=Novosphingobium sp. ZW T3_23 TaxID=3378084 RepID=UPI003852A6C1